ncbi:FAD-dependent oxidoreductase [Pseudomonas sp. 3A(2025)]
MSQALLSRRLQTGGRPALRVDVAVVGGGAAGVAAALAAAECGRSVALIEDYGFLGGTATVAGVQSYCGFYTRGEAPEQVVAGMGQRVLDGLRAMGLDIAPVRQSSGNWIILLDPERLKRVLDRLVEEAGIQTLLHCRVVATDLQGGKIQTLLCSDPDGLFQVEARTVVDATGNANIAAMIAPQSVRPRIQAATLTARITSVDSACQWTRSDLEAAAADYRQRTGHPLARANGGFFVRLPWSNSYWAMMVDVDLPDCTSSSLSRAESEARAIAHDYLDSLRRVVPGFAAAQLEVTGPRLGIRGTRSVRSQQDVRACDLLEARRRADGIARSGWPCELHPCPGVTEYQPIAGNGWFHVPYGALIPDGCCNLWLAGSCIGADDQAFGSIRVMGCAFATGHAAGVAAALSCGLAQRAPLAAIKTTLLEQGAIL